MCDRFAQFHSRDEYLAALAPDTPVSTTGTGMYGIMSPPARQCRCFITTMNQLQLAPVDWGYAPAWWRSQGKTVLINSRVENAASSRMFAPLWKHGHALVPASGWYEWKKSPDNPRLKQPYFIYPTDRRPLFSPPCAPPIHCVEVPVRAGFMV